jgi:hypothetical protein
MMWIVILSFAGMAMMISLAGFGKPGVLHTPEEPKTVLLLPEATIKQGPASPSANPVKNDDIHRVLDNFLF